MANFLFPCTTSVDHVKKQNNYHTILSDVVRSASDAIDALSLFRQLLTQHKAVTRSSGLTAFDAHGGDAGCHLRAAMFLDAYTKYDDIAFRDPMVLAHFDACLSKTIEGLRHVKANGVELYYNLVQDCLSSEDVGLPPKEATPRQILRRLGWADEVYTEPTWKRRTKGDPAEVHYPREPLAVSAEHEPSRDIVDGVLQRPSWNVFDAPVMIRFIVYAYTLSKYKRFLFNGWKITGMVDPRQVRGLTDALATSAAQNKQYKRPGSNRLEKEFKELKVWLSGLSTDWLLATCTKLPQLRQMTW